MDTSPPTADVLDYAAPGRKVARPPRPPVVRIVVFGLVLFPLIVALFHPIAWLLPVGTKTLAVVDVPTSRVRPDGFPAVVHISTGGPGTGVTTRMTGGAINYPYYPGGPQFWMTIDLRDMTCWPLTEVGQSRVPRPLTQETVRTALEKGGFDSASGEVSRLTTSIMAEVQKLAAGQLPAFDAAGVGNKPPAYHISWMEGTRWPRGLVWWPWYTPWCIPVWLLTWFLLARWLLRRHRRRLLAFQPSPNTHPPTSEDPG